MCPLPFLALGMRLGEAAALRVVGVVVLLRGAVPSAMLATHLGRRHTVALELLLVLVASGATAVWVAMPVASTVVLGVAGLGGALVLVNILPLVFDLGADTRFGAYTGLAAVPGNGATRVAPSVRRRFILCRCKAGMGDASSLARVRSPSMRRSSQLHPLVEIPARSPSIRFDVFSPPYRCGCTLGGAALDPAAWAGSPGA